MNVIDKVIGPDTACMLIKAHRPEGDDLAIGIRIKFSQFAQLLDRNTAQLGHSFLVVIADEVGKLLERHWFGRATVWICCFQQYQPYDGYSSI